MSSQPLISIITVVFNGEKYLEQTINSVIGQSYSNIEYIIIDGGSTDSTLSIIENYSEHISCWVSEPDKGLYDAMNKGIALAKGEIIGMINSDDWYELDAVELIVNNYLKFPEKKIFHGDRFDILPDGSKKIKAFNKSRFKFLFYGMTYNHPSMFVHKDIYEQGVYNINLKALSDFEFVLFNYLKQPDIFNYIKNSYVNYRLDGLSGIMKPMKAITEGFWARKNAGLGLFKNIFSVVVRTIRILLSNIT